MMKAALWYFYGLKMDGGILVGASRTVATTMEANFRSSIYAILCNASSRPGLPISLPDCQYLKLLHCWMGPRHGPDPPLPALATLQSRQAAWVSLGSSDVQRMLGAISAQACQAMEEVPRAPVLPVCLVSLDMPADTTYANGRPYG